MMSNMNPFELSIKLPELLKRLETLSGMQTGLFDSIIPSNFKLSSTKDFDNLGVVIAILEKFFKNQILLSDIKFDQRFLKSLEELSPGAYAALAIIPLNIYELSVESIDRIRFLTQTVVKIFNNE